jgi:hypothetical protein
MFFYIEAGLYTIEVKFTASKEGQKNHNQCKQILTNCTTIVACSSTFSPIYRLYYAIVVNMEIRLVTAMCKQWPTTSSYNICQILPYLQNLLCPPWIVVKCLHHHIFQHQQHFLIQQLLGGLYTAPHSSGGLQLEIKHFFVFVKKHPILCL